MALVSSRDAVQFCQTGGHVLKIVEQQARPQLSNGVACGLAPACMMVPYFL